MCIYSTCLTLCLSSSFWLFKAHYFCVNVYNVQQHLQLDSKFSNNPFLRNSWYSQSVLRLKKMHILSMVSIMLNTWKLRAKDWRKSFPNFALQKKKDVSKKKYWFDGLTQLTLINAPYVKYYYSSSSVIQQIK